MIGLDIAKTVFQVDGIDEAGNVVHRRELRPVAIERLARARSRC